MPKAVKRKVLFHQHEPSQFLQFLVYRRIGRQTKEGCQVGRIFVQYPQRLPVKQQINRYADFDSRLLRAEPQPLASVYQNEVMRGKPDKVRIAQSAVAAEKKRVQRMLQMPVTLGKCQLLQQLDFGGNQKHMLALHGLDAVIQKRIGIMRNISLANGFVDYCAQVFHVLGNGICLIIAPCHVVFKLNQEVVSQVLKVERRAECLQEVERCIHVAFRTLFSHRLLYPFSTEGKKAQIIAFACLHFIFQER